MAQIKGSALVPRFKYLDEKTSPGIKEKVISELSERFQEVVERSIFVGRWYPFEYYVEINRAMDKVLGKGDLSMIPSFGAYSADQAFTGVYKFFYKLGSPDFIITRATKVWNQYFQNGCLVIEKIGKKRRRLEMRDVEISAEEHCLSVLGWVKRTLELSGGKNVKAQITQCRQQGATACEILAGWE
ncbi:hypothetical protein KAR34_12380 [bacterium]|nr:hypothetical protein [bacterium]